MGTPMEWLPPSTRETVGLLKEASISAIASPASTSPPTVFKSTSTPLISSLSSMAASCGSTCSYFVVLVVGGEAFVSLNLADDRDQMNPVFHLHLAKFLQIFPVHSPFFLFAFLLPFFYLISSIAAIF